METFRTTLALSEPAERNLAALTFLGLPNDDKTRIFLMGSKYSPNTDAAALLDHIVSLPRFTYRHGFEAVAGFSSDTGWGCMMRTGQMAVASALLSLLHPTWRFSSVIESPDNDTPCKEILRKFEDASRALFSIQNIASMGLKLDVAVGQWFGPTTISHVIRRLVNEREDFPMRVYVAQDAVVSVSDLREASRDWSAPVLLLVPLRLGLHHIDPKLAEMACDTLTWPCSRGIMGGKPRASYYFIAQHGEELLYFDPHTPQPAVDMTGDFSSESFHSPTIHRINATSLDPSMALVFMCETADDCISLQHLVMDQGRLFDAQTLFTFVDEGGRTFDFSEDDAPSAEEGEKTLKDNKDPSTHGQEEWDML
eukprot:c14593_g1_i1.p1 GENE.c14593_g1_i1~~c14593_g1_i1.p1  ORF type:complete len:425 (-),score=87.94 c14593_g1_i1:126-1226(-)